MSISIAGTYQNGQVVLDSVPQGIERSRVKVEFEELPEGAEKRKFTLRFGMLATPGAAMSTLEDFDEVKRHWAPREY
jgi:hypothetical protein